MDLEFEPRTQVAPLVHSIRTLNPMSENSSLADALNLKVYPRTQRLWCLLLKANSNVGETNVGESIGSRSEPRTQLPFSVPSNQSLNSMLEKLSSVEASALVADPATTRTLNSMPEISSQTFLMSGQTTLVHTSLLLCSIFCFFSHNQFTSPEDPVLGVMQGTIFDEVLSFFGFIIIFVFLA